MSAGLLLTSRVHSLWAGFLTYGIGVGIGAGLYITPLFAVVGGWFDRSRAVGLGVVSAGSGLGTLLVNPTANRLIEAHGWRTTYVVLALVDLVVLLVVSTIVERPPIAPPPPGGGHLQAVSHTVPFRLLFASAHSDLIGGVVAVDGLPVFPTTQLHVAAAIGEGASAVASVHAYLNSPSPATAPDNRSTTTGHTTR